MSEDRVVTELRSNPRTWVVTGAAGFIGSHLVEALLALDQRVHGLDDFSSGHCHNLEQIRAGVRAEQWERFRFTQGDVRTFNHSFCPFRAFLANLSIHPKD